MPCPYNVGIPMLDARTPVSLRFPGVAFGTECTVGVLAVEFPLYRIVFDVLSDAIELIIATNDVLVITALPQRMRQTVLQPRGATRRRLE